MKRVQYACLEQTLHFLLKEEGYDHDLAVRAVREEVAAYKTSLERSRARYRVIEEREQSDGSVVLSVRKQYNGHDVGPYMD